MNCFLKSLAAWQFFRREFSCFLAFPSVTNDVHVRLGVRNRSFVQKAEVKRIDKVLVY